MVSTSDAVECPACCRWCCRKDCRLDVCNEKDFGNCESAGGSASGLLRVNFVDAPVTPINVIVDIYRRIINIYIENR